MSDQIAVVAPIPSEPQGDPYIQPGTPGEFEGQPILNNQENGAFVNLVPGNNRTGQMTHQANIETAFKNALRRKSIIPNFSGLRTRNTGGVFSPDNNVLEGISFGAALTAVAASTALIPDLTATVVTQDGKVLIEGDELLVKNGAVLSNYTNAKGVAPANISNLASVSTSQDGVTFANTDRILLAFQTNPKENGVYTYGGVAMGLGALTRSTDLDAAGEFIFGKGVKITAGGTLYGGHQFVVSEVPTVLNTDDIGIVDVTSTTGLDVVHAFDGLYTIGVVAGTAPATRSTDMDVAATAQGAVVNVTFGTLNGGKTFLNFTTVMTLNVTPFEFVDYSTLVNTAISTPVDNGVLNSDTQVYQLP